MTAPMTPRDLVRARRRVAMRLGFLALVVTSAAAATACIFDKGGEYQGGGRLDKGATAKTAEPEPTVSQSAPTNTTDPADAYVPPDAAGGGG